MAYTKTTWVNGKAPAINAANLNKIEQGIYDNDAALAQKASDFPYTVTLTVAGWSNNTQTVNIAAATATNSIVVSPIPAHQSAYSDAGILCTAQSSGSITFSCDSAPASAIQVNVLVID